LSKEKFRTRGAASKWVREHDFRTDKVDETENSFRYRQFAPTQCRERSFRNIRLDEGVSAVICRPKDVAAVDRGQASDDGCGLTVNTTKLDAIASDAELFCQLDVSFDAELILRRSDGASVDASVRKALLEQSIKGAAIELGMDVIGFQQKKDKPRPLPASMSKLANSRFFTFRQTDLARFAKSFTGRPFLRDHDRKALLARGGSILSSELREHKGELQFVQSVKLVKPWAVQAALDGTLESFSIGWDPSKPGLRGLQESLHCTVCSKPLFSHDCPHMPGDTAKVAKSEESVIVEAEFRNPRGAELSGVSFPAVTGTHVQTIRPQ
jgi:hypothetical protein